MITWKLLVNIIWICKYNNFTININCKCLIDSQVYTCIVYIDSIHPAQTVITNFIKITLNIEKCTYNAWSELIQNSGKNLSVWSHNSFLTHWVRHDTFSQNYDPQLWLRLDAVYLQWIYRTITDELLDTIIEHDSTAEIDCSTSFTRIKILGLST